MGNEFSGEDNVDLINHEEAKVEMDVDFILYSTDLDCRVQFINSIIKNINAYSPSTQAEYIYAAKTLIMELYYDEYHDHSKQLQQSLENPLPKEEAKEHISIENDYDYDFKYKEVELDKRTFESLKKQVTTLEIKINVFKKLLEN